MTASGIKAAVLEIQNPRGEPSRALFWITSGSLAVIDQALIAASNFIIGILLARWLAPAQYGSYAIAFAAFLLFSAFEQALLLEPQRIFGPSEYRDCLREYLGVLLSVHGVLGLAISIALAVSASVIHIFMWSDTLPGALAGVAIAAPCILLMWLLRGAFYVKLSPHDAVKGSAVYCAAVAGGLFLIYSLHIASPFSAFLVMGVAALISSAVLLLQLKPVLPGSFTDPNWRTVSSEHWQYGRWVLASLVLNAIAGDIYYPLVSSFSGESAAGELKALMNFFMLVAQTLSALSFFFLPYAARVRQEKGRAALQRVTWRIAWIFGGLSVAYWGVLVALGTPLLQLVYGGRYTSLAPLVPLVAAASLPWNIAVAPAITLRAMRTSSSIFVIYCASSAAAILVGVPATWAFKLPGALVAMCVSNMAALAAALMLVRHELQRRSE